MKYKKLIEMYSYYIMRWYTKGVNDNLSEPIDNDKIMETYDKLISQDYVLKLYHVTEHARKLSLSLISMLRSSAPEGCYIDVVTSIDREVIDWNSSYMQKIKKTWSASTKEHPTNLQANQLNSSEDYKMSAKTSDAIESWNKMAEKTAQGHASVRTEITVLCFYRKPISMREIIAKEARFISKCSEESIILTPIHGDMFDYMQTIAPTSIPQRQPIKQFSTMLDENVALYETYIPGKIGGKKIYLGRDIDQKMFVFEDILNTAGGALNIILIGITGSGKSFYIKFFTEIFLASKINEVVWDTDGEYEFLANGQDMVIISLGAEGGKYYNTVPISSNTPNALSSSINDTLAIFEMLADVNTGMLASERYVFNLGYNYMFNTHGIDKLDKTTWSNSDNLTYQDLYQSILAVSEEVPETEMEIYNNFCRKLFLYFDPAGMHSQVFDKPLNVKEILDQKQKGQPLMVCINMQSKNNPDKDAFTRLLDRIKSNTMSNVTSLVINHNKAMDEYTALIVEEVNQHLDNNDFISMINTNVTGGRKLNLIPILATNSIQRMVESDNKSLQDILDNMDTVIVGALNSKASELVQDRYNLRDCKDTLRDIELASQKSNDSKYKNAFLVRTKREIAVVKATVPPHIAKTRAFKTRTIEEKE